VIELIHIHIPKTAGTSFSHVLMDEYGQPKLKRVYPPKQHTLVPVRTFIRWANSAWWTDRGRFLKDWHEAFDEEGLNEEFCALTGHNPVGLYNPYFPGVPRVTFLRRPVELQLSWYFFERQHPHLMKNNTSIYEYLEMKEHQNIMTTMTGGNLDAFGFIGFLETFAEDVIRLARIMDWKPVMIRHKMRHAHPSYDADYPRLVGDPAVVDAIRRANAADCALYREAVSRR
jgi:hypothetical protein